MDAVGRAGVLAGFLKVPAPLSRGLGFEPPDGAARGLSAQILSGHPRKLRSLRLFTQARDDSPAGCSVVIFRLNRAFSEIVICFYFEPFLNVVLVFMITATSVRIHLVILLNQDSDKKSDCQDCDMEIFRGKEA